jgi:hypothetical protein
MKSPEECVAEAEKCDRLMATAQTEEDRRVLAFAATEWRKLAKEVPAKS